MIDLFSLPLHQLSNLLVRDVDYAMDLLLMLLGIGLLTFLHAIFVAFECALINARPDQGMRLSGELRGETIPVSAILKRNQSYLVAARFGALFTTFLLGFLLLPIIQLLIDSWISALELSDHWIYWISLSICFPILLFFHLMLGELVPKAIGSRRSETTLKILFLPIDFFTKSFFWVLRPVEKASEFLLRMIFRIEPACDSDSAHSAEELAILVTKSEKFKDVTDTEREILINALELNELWVRDIMTPQNQIVVLNVDDSFEDNLELIQRTKHTRFPLVKGSLDQAFGLIHIKDIFKIMHHPDPDLIRIKRDLKMVPDNMPLDTLLKFFLKEHTQLAVAVDEFGTPVGVVFLDNVIEELVGEIHDEFDQVQSSLTKINDHEFIIDGTTTLYELECLVPELTIESEEITTVGGYITQKLGRFPVGNETLEILGYEARVTSVENHRVGKIHFTKKTQPNHLAAETIL